MPPGAMTNASAFSSMTSFRRLIVSVRTISVHSLLIGSNLFMKVGTTPVTSPPFSNTPFAQEGPCVIVGRCANYILEQADIDSFDVFIRANIEKRMANVSDRVDLKGDELVKFLQKRDHKRRVYYRFYTKRKWGDYHDYNMMLDSGAIGKENCINLIIKAIGE